MEKLQIKTLFSKVNDKLNIRFDCITDADTKVTKFEIQGNIRQ